MAAWMGSRATALGLAAAALLATACSPIRNHQGYLFDETLASAIQPGVDNRESVQQTLGRPTFTGQFSDRDWYYFSRGTRALAFAMPKPEDQTVLRITFDESGTVSQVQRTGLELVQKIDPANETTPTLGSRRTFFDEIFGNIGALGTPGERADTADNPQ